jgi:hypothetical protein
MTCPEIDSMTVGACEDLLGLAELLADGDGWLLEHRVAGERADDAELAPRGGGAEDVRLLGQRGRRNEHEKHEDRQREGEPVGLHDRLCLSRG